MTAFAGGGTAEMATKKPSAERSDRFADRDVDYFRDEQYGTPDKLNSRILLHAKYASAGIDWFEWLHTHIEWQPVKDALEVGCGTGLFWSRLPNSASANLRVTLVDLSPGMVVASTSRARERLVNVTGLEADVQNLPFDGESFDLVIANQMLYHATDPARALAELHRILRPRGILVAATNGPDHLRELFQITTVAFQTVEFRSNADVFGRVTGRELLDQYFAEVTWHQFEDELLCTNVEDVVAYLTSTPPGEDASFEQVQRMHAEIERRMRKANGVLRVTKDAGVFVSRRASLTPPP